MSLPVPSDTGGKWSLRYSLDRSMHSFCPSDYFIVLSGHHLLGNLRSGTLLTLKPRTRSEYLFLFFSILPLVSYLVSDNCNKFIFTVLWISWNIAHGLRSTLPHHGYAIEETPNPRCRHPLGGILSREFARSRKIHWNKIYRIPIAYIRSNDWLLYTISQCV